MDKNKIIEAATRYVQRGHYDKAIAEYRKILQKDPKDVRILLKIGELQQKKGEYEPAASTLTEVANAYAAEGFFLKAVAVFKQVLKLSPERVEVILRLAELYQQLGLMSDAMTQLQAAASHYEKAGRVEDSTEIFRRMVSLEPENVPSRLRLADLLARQGKTQEALSELRKVAGNLRSGNRIEDWLRVGERIVQLDPKDQNLGRELAAAYLAKNDMRRALERLQVCFHEDPRNVETLELLAKAFVGVGQRPKATAVYKELAKVHRDRGRQAEAQAALRKALDLTPDDPELRRALGLAQPPQEGPPSQPPRLGQEGQEPARRSPQPPPAAVPPAPAEVARPQPPPRPGPVVSAGDAPAGGGAGAEQVPEPAPIARLLTETDVFLRYGLADKAAEHLEKIFALDPEEPGGHERAVELYRDRDPDRLCRSLAILARVYAERGELDRGRPHFAELLRIAPRHEAVARLAPRYGMGAPASAPAAAAVPPAAVVAPPAEAGAGIGEASPLPVEDEPLLVPLAEVEESVVLEPDLAEAEAAGPAFVPVGEDELLALASDEVSDDVVEEPLLRAVGSGEAGQVVAETPPPPASLPVELTDEDLIDPSVEDEPLDELVPPREETIDLVLPEAQGEGEEILLEDEPLDESVAISVEEGADEPLVLAEGPALPEGPSQSGAAVELDEEALLELAEESAGDAVVDAEPELEMPPFAEASIAAEGASGTIAEETAVELRGEEVASPAPSGEAAAFAPFAVAGEAAEEGPTAAGVDPGSTTVANADPFARTPFVPSDSETREVDYDAVTAAAREGMPGGPVGGARRREPGLVVEPAGYAPLQQDPVNPWRVTAAELADVEQELEEADFYFQQGLYDEAEALYRAVDRRVPGHPLAAERIAEIVARRREEQARQAGLPVPEEPAGFDSAPGEEGLFDLGAALAEELALEEEHAETAPSGFGVEEVFEEFKKGVAETVRPEDVDTHYNLAIAYKEMGLIADAIATFEQALTGCRGTERAIDCLTMIGLCHRSLGDHGAAIEAFARGLEEGAPSPEVQKALLYEIAHSYEDLGDKDEALATYGRLARIDGSYRDVRAAIARLVAAGAIPRPLDEAPGPARRAGGR